jgi:uncharacterized protein with GYD domain
MPKFLVQASYTAEGIQGLQKDRASGRQAAVVEAAQSLGGALESMHFALGADDVVIILDLPDVAAAAALGAIVAASGLIRATRATALLTVAEMDEALSRHPSFHAPGR